MYNWFEPAYYILDGARCPGGRRKMTESHIPYLLTWVRTYRRSGRKGRMVVQVSRVGIVADDGRQSTF